MKGWLYLIKNGDLYKIGITKNFEKRMMQLKPDKIITKLYSSSFKRLERELHSKYKKVRIPQTEYFRLDRIQIRDIKKRISQLNFTFYFMLKLFFESCLIISISFFALLLLMSLAINDLSNAIFESLLWSKRITFFLSLFSLFKNSGKYYGFMDEIKFRFIKFIYYLSFTLLINFYAPGYFFNRLFI